MLKKQSFIFLFFQFYSKDFHNLIFHRYSFLTITPCPWFSSFAIIHNSLNLTNSTMNWTNKSIYKIILIIPFWQWCQSPCKGKVLRLRPWLSVHRNLTKELYLRLWLKQESGFHLSCIIQVHSRWLYRKYWNHPCWRWCPMLSWFMAPAFWPRLCSTMATPSWIVTFLSRIF